MVALSSLAGTKPACILEAIISDEMFMAVQREEQKRSNTQKNMASIKLTFLPESPDISGLSGF